MKSFHFDAPDEYVNGTPFAIFERWRREAPFAWHDSANVLGEGFWIATRHADIVTISRNPALFATTAAIIANPLPRELWPDFPALAMLADNLMTFEPHRHLVFRSVASPLFSAGRASEMEGEVAEICAGLLDSVSRRSRFDFAHDVALPIPLESVMGKFLGVPREDLPMVSGWVLTLNAMDDPAYRPHTDSFQEAAEALFAYGQDLIRRSARHPDRSRFTDLVQSAMAHGLSARELTSAYWFPMAAGAFDTTASTIAGGVEALIRFPCELSRLRADPSGIRNAVEEILRWVSPVVYFRRTATADTEFHGNRIAKGDKVLLCYASGNRDEDVFSEPDKFDVTRTPNPHLTFGYGPHFCIGAQIAQMVLRVFLKEFVHRMPALQTDGDIIRTRSGWMNRIRIMPVRMGGATAAA